MTDQGRANEDEAFRTNLQGVDPNQELSWVSMGSWQQSSNTNLDPGTSAQHYLDIADGVADTSSRDFYHSSDIAVTGTSYPSRLGPYSFAEPPHHPNWLQSVSGPESVPWPQPYGYHQPQHGLYQENGSAEQPDFSYMDSQSITINEGYSSFIEGPPASNAVPDIANYTVGPYTPFQPSGAALGFYTANGGQYNIAGQQPQALEPHTQQAPFTSPTTETTNSSWVVPTPQTSPNRHISEGVESTRHEGGELALDSSPSRYGPSRSQSADLSQEPISPLVKAEEIPESQRFKGDPRYQHQSRRNLVAFRGRAQKTKVSKRTGKLTEEGREKAAKMRKKGRCLRCKYYKLGCDGNNPCQKCVKVCNSARQYLEPCCRPNIKEASLVRQSNGRFNQNPVEFRSYHFVNAEGTAPTIQVQWSLPGRKRIEAPTLSVPYREYVPDNYQGFNTTTYYIHATGRTNMIETAPFAACDQARLLLDVEGLLHRAQPQVEQWIFSKYKRERDQLYLLTFTEACRYRDRYRSRIIDRAIQMQSGAIMSQGYGSVVESDYHPFPRIQYTDQCEYDAYNRGKDVPVPQAIGHQLDVAILKHIAQLQQDLIKELDTKIFQPGVKPWYEIFLTCFIVLSNLEWIHDQSRAYVESKKETMLASQVSHVVRTQILQWQFSVKIVLQHFRVILKGFLPFSLARDQLAEVKDRAGLDDDATSYIQATLRLLDEQKSEFENTAAPGEEDAPAAGRWIHQLFAQSYKPV